MMFFEQIRSM